MAEEKELTARQLKEREQALATEVATEEAIAIAEVARLAEENRPVIEELIARATEAASPGPQVGEVVNKGSADNPMPAVITSMEEAGWTFIYDRRTGDRSVCNNNMLSTKLRQKVDGILVFTTIDPKIRVTPGTIKCRLHKDDLQRPEWDKMGLPKCNKANITSEYELSQHMQKKHKKEWAAIEKIRIDTERKEDRAAQRAMTEALTEMAKK